MPTARRYVGSSPTSMASNSTTFFGTTMWQLMYSPTVKIEEEPPTKLDLVQALDQEVLIADSDWRAPILDFIIKSPTRRTGSTSDLPTEPQTTSSLEPSCSGTRLPQEPFPSASLSKMEFGSHARSTLESAEITRDINPGW